MDMPTIAPTRSLLEEWLLVAEAEAEALALEDVADELIVDEVEEVELALPLELALELAEALEEDVADEVVVSLPLEVTDDVALAVVDVDAEDVVSVEVVADEDVDVEVVEVEDDEVEVVPVVVVVSRWCCICNVGCNTDDCSKPGRERSRAMHAGRPSSEAPNDLTLAEPYAGEKRNSFGEKRRQDRQLESGTWKKSKWERAEGTTLHSSSVPTRSSCAGVNFDLKSLASGGNGGGRKAYRAITLNKPNQKQKLKQLTSATTATAAELAITTEAATSTTEATTPAATTTTKEAATDSKTHTTKTNQPTPEIIQCNSSNKTKKTTHYHQQATGLPTIDLRSDQPRNGNGNSRPLPRSKRRNRRRDHARRAKRGKQDVQGTKHRLSARTPVEMPRKENRKLTDKNIESRRTKVHTDKTRHTVIRRETHSNRTPAACPTPTNSRAGAAWPTAQAGKNQKRPDTAKETRPCATIPNEPQSLNPQPGPAPTSSPEPRGRA
ncbi:hypothetical protein FISHEDRAFT_57703 [Fistulina hepatica ATCC 64428]|uniref:Uncharacterized protein n=1 Tax=Fistulina hepatica ATCC 64428 TaxID=1128425 RepID=A0A0D7AHT6_9AGAR|nr:hypothetical protein FISHEDRAFT_57703 [Fistulina hepatica ATCC 64428]